MAYSRRSYKGAPVANAIGGSTLAPGATSITLAASISSSWATSNEPFFIVIDPGTSKEEKVCVIYNTATNLVVVDPAATSGWTANTAGRGADDTVDRQHDIGAVVYPVFTATEANQANELVSKYATNGDLVTHGSTGLKKVATGGAGNNNKVLTADSTVDGGVKWSSIATASIADDAVTSVKIADSSVTSAKIADGTIVLADLATALQRFLVPVGSINAYAGTTAPLGWLMCNGTSTAGYTALAALVGATTPDMQGRFPIGDNGTLTLLGTGGSTTIAEGNLPSHTHTFSGTSQDMNRNSTPGHSVIDPGHNHTQNPHNHTQDAHDHGTSATRTFTTGGHTHDNADYFMAGVNGAGVYGGGGSSIDAATATNQATTAGNNSNTTGISISAHNISHEHTYSGTTNGGTGAGTAYYQPYLVVNYIIKHD